MARFIIKLILLFLIVLLSDLFADSGDFKLINRFSNKYHSNYKLKVVNIKGKYVDSLNRYWNRIKDREISIRDIEKISKRVGQLYVLDGYLDTKIYYRIIGRVVYLIYDKGGIYKTFVKVSSSDTALSYSCKLNKLDSIVRYELSRDSLYFSKLVVDSISVKDSNIFFYIHKVIEKHLNYQELVIKPKKGKNIILNQYRGFNYDTLLATIDKVNRYGFVRFSKPKIVIVNDSIKTVSIFKNRFENRFNSTLSYTNKRLYGDIHFKFFNFKNSMNSLIFDWDKYEAYLNYSIYYSMLLQVKNRIFVPYINLKLINLDSLSNRILIDFGNRYFFSKLNLETGIDYRVDRDSINKKSFYGFSLSLNTNNFFSIYSKDNYSYSIKWSSYFNNHDLYRNIFLNINFKRYIYKFLYINRLSFLSGDRSDFKYVVVDKQYNRAILPIIYNGNDLLSLKNSFYLLTFNSINFYLFLDYVNYIDLLKYSFGSGIGVNFKTKSSINLDLVIAKNFLYRGNLGVISVGLGYNF